MEEELCGHRIYRRDGDEFVLVGTCALKPGHKDSHRTQAALDERDKKRREKYINRPDEVRSEENRRKNRKRPDRRPKAAE